MSQSATFRVQLVKLPERTKKVLNVNSSISTKELLKLIEEKFPVPSSDWSIQLSFAFPPKIIDNDNQLTLEQNGIKNGDSINVEFIKPESINMEPITQSNVQPLDSTNTAPINNNNNNKSNEQNKPNNTANANNHNENDNNYNCDKCTFSNPLSNKYCSICQSPNLLYSEDLLSVPLEESEITETREPLPQATEALIDDRPLAGLFNFLPSNNHSTPQTQPPLPQSQSQAAGQVINNNGTENSTSQNESWECNKCTFRNNGNTLICEACNFRRSNPRAPVQSSGSSASASVRITSSSSSGVNNNNSSFSMFNTRTDKWICEACGVDNHPQLIRCKNCPQPNYRLIAQQQQMSQADPCIIQ